MFSFCALLLYVYFPFLPRVKFCCGCFRHVFFLLGDKKKWSLVALGRWSSYTVTIVWGFACADSALVVLDEWRLIEAVVWTGLTVFTKHLLIRLLINITMVFVKTLLKNVVPTTASQCHGYLLLNIYFLYDI